MKFLLEIITPERKAFSEEVDLVSVPTSEGIIGVKARHAPLFTSIIEGEVKIAADDNEYYLAIGGGFMQVANGKVIILVSRAVHADELNAEEIEKAQKQARELIATLEKGAERQQAQSLFKRTLLDMKVLQRKNRRSQTIH